MSRVAKQPVVVPNGVNVEISDDGIVIKGSNGTLKQRLNPNVSVVLENNEIKIEAKSDARACVAQAGTARALIANMVLGVVNGFEKTLDLVGVGYRAQVQGKKLNLSLGFSHPVEFFAPDGISISAPSQNQVVVNGADKQLVGQVAANIRAFRPPEPYKGKGVRYSDERIIRKEAKKK